MNRRWAILFFVFSMASTFVARADPTVEISQSFRFGNYVLRPNNIGANLQVAYDGQVIADSAFMPVNSNPRNGVIKLSGFTPNDPLDLNITFTPNPLTLSCSCSSPDFQVSNFQVETENVTTDINGEALIRYGARITAQGGSYSNASYSGTVTISVVVNN